MRSARLVLSTALLLAGAACGLVAGIGDSYRASDGVGDGGLLRDGADGTGTEDCLDGIDNDGNGLVDCQDPKCVGGGFVCVDAPPAGWDGVAITRRDPSDNTIAPACGDGGAATTYFEGLAADPATCSPCTCDKPDGGSCSASFACYMDNTCGGPPKGPTPVLVGPTCTAELAVPGANGCKVTATVADGGACPAAGGAMATPVPWAHRDDLCRTGIVGGKGCGATQVCVNRGANLPQIACLRARGDVGCPPGWSATVSLYPKAGVVDQRGCTPCTCGAPTGGSCTGASVTVNSDIDCTGSTNVTVTGCSKDNTLIGMIQAASGWGAKSSGATLTPGTCAPRGGQATGTFDAGAPEGFCCAP
jgi:hypothetical protein